MFIDIKTNFFEMFPAKFYQGSIVLLIVTQPPIRLVLVRLFHLKEMWNFSKMRLLENIGTTGDSLKKLDKTKLFFQTVLYSGKGDKSFVSTRKRLRK